MCCVVFTLRKPTSGFIQTAADTGGRNRLVRQSFLMREVTHFFRVKPYAASTFLVIFAKINFEYTQYLHKTNFFSPI